MKIVSYILYYNTFILKQHLIESIKHLNECIIKSNIARNVGQAVKNVRNIGSTVNEISGGRIGNSRFGQKMQEITDKVESGANFIANNEDKAQGFIGDVSRKINA